MSVAKKWCVLWTNTNTGRMGFIPVAGGVDDRTRVFNLKRQAQELSSSRNRTDDHYYYETVPYPSEVPMKAT